MPASGVGTPGIKSGDGIVLLIKNLHMVVNLNTTDSAVKTRNTFNSVEWRVAERQKALRFLGWVWATSRQDVTPDSHIL